VAQSLSVGCSAIGETEIFREICLYVFDAVDELILSRRERLLDSALERKSEGMSDESNMEQLVRELRTSDLE